MCGGLQENLAYGCEVRNHPLRPFGVVQERVVSGLFIPAGPFGGIHGDNLPAVLFLAFESDRDVPVSR